MPLNITITDAGRAAIINAENTGTDPVTLAEIGVGSGQYNPAANQTALSNEIKRLNTIAGAVVDDDVIHVTLRDDSADSYSVGEIGLYTDAGVLFAVYSQTGAWIVEKATLAQLLLAIDITLTGVNAASITFGDTDFSMSAATHSVPGVVRLADGQETVDAAQDDIAVTPVGLDAVVTIINQLIQNNATDISSNSGAITDLQNAVAGLSGNQSLVQNGYKQMEGGLIIQWGKVTGLSAGAVTTISFPIAFPNACFSVAQSESNTVDGTGILNIISASFDIDTDTPATAQLHWIAMGH